MRKVLLVLTILLLVFALTSCGKQYESFDDVNESDYSDYKQCVDECSGCELKCKDDLLQTTATKGNDLTICDQIKTDSIKEECVVSIQSMADEELYSQAISGKDLTVCDNIEDNFTRSTCMVQVQATKAVDQNDLTLCDSLSSELVGRCKEHAEFRIAALNDDLSYCDKFGAEEKDDCKKLILEEV